MLARFLGFWVSGDKVWGVRLVTRLGFRESPMGALHPSPNTGAGRARSGLYTKRYSKHNSIRFQREPDEGFTPVAKH